jgi:rhodanese-related sulfurtransferase
MQTTTTHGRVPEEADRITIDEINKREAAGEQFTYVDVRNDKDWAAAEKKLPTALRIPLDKADAQLSDINKDRTVVTYCT